MCGPAIPIVAAVVSAAGTAYAANQQRQAQDDAMAQQRQMTTEERQRADEQAAKAQQQAEADRIAQEQAEAARQSRIKGAVDQTNNAFSKYNDDYYNKISTDYTNYYMPQLDQQQQDARQKIVYDLARSGNLDSSASDDRFKKLTETYDNQRTAIGQKALEAAAAQRSKIDNTRNSLIQQAQAGSGLENFGNTLTSQIDQLNTVNSNPTYEPIGSVFDPLLTDFGNYNTAVNNGYTGLQGAVQPIGDGIGTLFDQLNPNNKKNKSVSEIV